MPKRRRTQTQVIVIGAGISGLTAAAYLARAGCAVTIYEQAPEIGGVTATLSQDGYKWDLGPLLLEGFARDERAGRILRDLGVASRVPLKMDDRTYVFPDFDLRKPANYPGPQWRRERLGQLFPSERDGIRAYYRFYNKMLDVVTLNVRADLARGPWKTLLRLRLWRAFNRVKALQNWSAEKLMNEFFVDARLKAVFTSILADFVARPSRFPALGVPVLNVESSFDTRIPRRASLAGQRPSYHYVRGGCGTLVEAIAAMLRDLGVKLYTGTAVERVLIDADRMRGVRLATGQTENADVVIATGGAQETFLHLVGRQYLPSYLGFQIDELPLMESVFMVQLGVDFDPRPYQPEALTYYYGTYEIEAAIARCQRGDYHEGADGFLIYIPSYHSPEMAPDGHHALTIYTIAPNELQEGTWQGRRRELTAKLLAHAEAIIPDLRAHIKTQVVLTPEDFRSRTHQLHHAFGGCAPLMGHEGLGYDTPIEGLWFIGSQSKSGGGVQNVMVGARDAARQILAHARQRRTST